MDQEAIDSLKVALENISGGGVARDETLQGILAELSRQSSGFSKAFADFEKGVSGMTDAANKRTRSERASTDATEERTKAVEADTESLYAHERALDRAEESIKKFGSTITSTAGGVGKNMLDLGTGSGNVVDAFKSVGDGVSGAVGQIPGLGTAFKTAASTFVGANALVFGAGQKTYETFLNLSNSGVAFGGDMMAMKDAVNASGFTMENFTNALSKNVSGLSRFAGTGTQGAKALSNLSKSIQTQGLDRQLARMGIAVKDQPEFMAEFAGNLAGMGFTLDRFEGRFNDVANMAVKYNKELKIAQQLTGESNEEQQARQKAIAKDAQFQAKLRSMGAEEAVSMQAMMQSVPEALMPAVKDLMLFGTVTAENAGLMMAYPKQLELINQSLSAGADAAETYTRGLEANADTLKDEEENARELVAMASVSSSEALKTVSSAYIDIANQVDRIAGISLAREEQEQIADTESDKNMTDEFTGITMSLEEFRNTLSGVLTDELNNSKEMLGNFKAALEGAETAVEKMGPTFISTLSDPLGAVGVGVATGITQIIGIIAAKKLAGSAGLLSGLTGMIPGAGAGSAGGAGGAGGGAPRPPAGGAGGGRNPGMGALGNMSGGLLRGIAGGLSAFANPKIVIGATFLGAAITAIGAGIAGAAWLTGKALPTFSEGMKSFEDLDGTALINAGKGMAAVAGGMAAFGAGSAVAGLGSLVGGITEGIGKLFGAEDPMEKIKRFQTYDLDEAKITGNANAVVAFSKAMAVQGAAQAAEGLGGLAGNIANGISSFFFGDDDPFAAIKEFGEMNLNRQKILENAQTVMAYSTAVRAYSGDLSVQSAAPIPGLQTDSEAINPATSRNTPSVTAQNAASSAAGPAAMSTTDQLLQQLIRIVKSGTEAEQELLNRIAMG